MLGEHREKVRVRITLVQEQRAVMLRRERKLQRERAALVSRRRKIAIEIQTTFARRDYEWVRQQLGQARDVRGMKERCVMRMYACRCAQLPGPLPAHRQRTRAVVNRAAGHDHRRDASLASAPDHDLAIPIETVVREIGPDIDQRKICG